MSEGIFISGLVKSYFVKKSNYVNTRELTLINYSLSNTNFSFHWKVGPKVSARDSKFHEEEDLEVSRSYDITVKGPLDELSAECSCPSGVKHKKSWLIKPNQLPIRVCKHAETALLTLIDSTADEVTILKRKRAVQLEEKKKRQDQLRLFNSRFPPEFPKSDFDPVAIGDSYLKHFKALDQDDHARDVRLYLVAWLSTLNSDPSILDFIDSSQHQALWASLPFVASDKTLQNCLDVYLGNDLYFLFFCQVFNIMRSTMVRVIFNSCYARHARHPVISHTSINHIIS